MKIGWGITGCGRIAMDAVAPAIAASHNGRLVALGSRDAEAIEAKLRRSAAHRAYGSYEALLADPEIDAVYIGLPNGLHEPFAVLAAHAGKHALCEKSLSLRSAFRTACWPQCRARCAARIINGSPSSASTAASRWRSRLLLVGIRRRSSSTGARSRFEAPNHYLHEVEHFAELVMHPSRPMFPAENGLCNVRVCEEIARSFQADAPASARLAG